MPCFATLSCSDGSPSRCKKKVKVTEEYWKLRQIGALTADNGELLEDYQALQEEKVNFTVIMIGP